MGHEKVKKKNKSKIVFCHFFRVRRPLSLFSARRPSRLVLRAAFSPNSSLALPFFRSQRKNASSAYPVPGWRAVRRTGWGTGALSRVRETIRSMTTTRLALRRRRKRIRNRLPRLLHQTTRRSLRGSAPRRCSPQRAALLRPRSAPRPSSCGPIPIRAHSDDPLDTPLLLPLPRRRRREGPGASLRQRLLLTPLPPTSARSRPRTPRWLPRRRRPR